MPTNASILSSSATSGYDSPVDTMGSSLRSRADSVSRLMVRPDSSSTTRSTSPAFNAGLVLKPGVSNVIDTSAALARTHSPIGKGTGGGGGGGQGRTGVVSSTVVTNTEPKIITVKGFTPPMARKTASRESMEAGLGDSQVMMRTALAAGPPPPSETGRGRGGVYQQHQQTQHQPEKPVVRVNERLEQIGHYSTSDSLVSNQDERQLAVRDVGYGRRRSSTGSNQPGGGGRRQSIGKLWEGLEEEEIDRSRRTSPAVDDEVESIPTEVLEEGEVSGD